MTKFVHPLLALALLALTSLAHAWPERSVTMIVPYAPGGSTDMLARLLAEPMGKSLGVPVVVENVGGAGGVPGVQRFMRADNDGYTIIFSNMGSFAIAPTLQPAMKFQPKTQIAPLGLVAEVPMVLSVSTQSGIKSLPALLARMRDASQPTINWGNGGPGSTANIGTEYFLWLTQTRAQQLYYRGTGPVLVDLMAGTIDVAIDQTVAMIPASKGGRVLPIAVVGTSRIPQLPDTPTFAEGGVPEFDMTVWNAIAAPKGVAPERLAKLVTALNAALDALKVTEALATLGTVAPPPERRGPAVLQTLIERDNDRFAKLIHDAGIPINR